MEALEGGNTACDAAIAGTPPRMPTSDTSIDPLAARPSVGQAALRVSAVLGAGLFTLAAIAVLALASGSAEHATDSAESVVESEVRPQPAMFAGPVAFASDAEIDATAGAEPAAGPPATSADTTASKANTAAPNGVWVQPLVIENPAALGDAAAATIPVAPFMSPVATTPNSEPQSIAPAQATRRETQAEQHVVRQPPAIEPPSPGQVPALTEKVAALVATDLAGMRQEPLPDPLVDARPAVPPLSETDRASFTASTTDLNQRLSPMVREGFQLGRAGAMYAARSRFIGVLRRIATAKDAEAGSNEHATALAAGLRALEEADDFAPRGDALEAELDVRAIAQSHTTPMLNERVASERTAAVSAHDAGALYSRYAAEQLGRAVYGEPAGSMALFGLGKTYARVEAQSGDPHAGRKCLVMHRAALVAHNQNHMAANELGVRLAMAGRYEQASEALRLAASKPGAAATVYENLAQVESRLGNPQVAQQTAAVGQSVAQSEMASGAISQRHGVTWVSPEAFGGRSATPTPPPAQTVATQAAPPTPSSNPFTQAVDFVKRKSGWSQPTAATQPQPQPYQRVGVRPTTTVVR